MSIEEMLDALNKSGCGSPYFDIWLCLDYGDLQGGGALIKDYFQCDDEMAERCLMAYKEKFYDPFKASFTPEDRARFQAETRALQNKPKCPTCNSRNIKKISTTSKVVNTAMFGIFGTKRHKQFHCNQCGYEW